MSDIIVGIDLGTTNSAVAVVQDGKPRILAKGEQRLLPSVVAYSQDGNWLVGQSALNQYVLNPDSTVRSIKRQMGSDTQVQLGKHSLNPQQISAFILRELKSIAENALGQPVNKAVITVPAYFTNAQRQATQEAGQIAGLEVVRIINEPTAAALAYGLDHEEDCLALVYDLGGGTFDVSLVEMIDGIVEVRASHGDNELGGDDFDELLADHAKKLFYKKHQFSLKDNRQANARLNRMAEAAKVGLSSLAEVDLREEYLLEKDNIPYHLDDHITRNEFEDLTSPLLERTLAALEKVFEDAELTPEDLDRVLLVGGSTRMPAVWDLVARYIDLEPDGEINPDEVVALGAAVQAAIIAGQPVDAILVDVTPHSLGIEIAKIVGNGVVPDIYEVLIHRNTTIPVTHEKIFTTLHPDQKTVEVKVYQGEAPIASANTLLGQFLVENLTAKNPGELPTVTVRFDFDVNGILEVSAIDRGSNQAKNISLQANHVRLSPQDIAAARDELADFEVFADPDEAISQDEQPVIDEETKVLMNRAQTLLDSDDLDDEQRSTLLGLLNDITQAETQADLDFLAEELLDILFDLE